MSLVDHSAPSPQERAWQLGEARTVALTGTINMAVARLVATIRMLIDTDGWHGHGIQSVEHWVTWKAGVSGARAGNLVRIARRIPELPACWGLFEQGRLTEDAMSLIARRVPAERDAEVAGWAPRMLVAQLSRALRSCPEVPVDESAPPKAARERYLRMFTDETGWGRGEFALPPDETAQLQVALDLARDAEFAERGDDAEPVVTMADAFVRLTQEGLDGLDATLVRTGHRGERTKVVLHHDIDPDGRFGPGQLHNGPVIPDTLARFLACDAEVMAAVYVAGQLLGITPTERAVNRRLRRIIERRDQGCAHPLCTRRRHLHVHHLEHWEHGGLTIPANLLCLCPLHHRELHQGLFSIIGNPETGTLRFLDARGSPIEPPHPGPARPLRPVEPTPYTPPTGERLDPRWFSWN